MDGNPEKYMKLCYELAVGAGEKGHDTFGAVLVHDGEILEEAENTADYARKIFGHAEFNLVHKCANKYSDEILEKSIVYPVHQDFCSIMKHRQSVPSKGVRVIPYHLGGGIMILISMICFFVDGNLKTTEYAQLWKQ